MSVEEAISVLMSSREHFRTALKAIIAVNKFNYRSFGIEIEDYAREILVEVFKQAGLINRGEDCKIAKDKNEFPDFTLLTRPNLAIEIKSGNHYKLEKGKWCSCNNSGNDMGTLNKWPEKLRIFGGQYIYYVFIEYCLTDTLADIADVKIAPFYKFLGLNRAGLLKYREKDGNLRPKDFDAISPIQTFEEFENLIPKTNKYRAKRIIKKHLQSIPKGERNAFLDSLKTHL